MTTYTLRKDQQALSFDPTIPPVLEINSGDTVTFETGDAAYDRLSKGETVDGIGIENFNAVTGPVFIRGAEPGDAIQIEVLDVQVTRAWSVWLPDFGMLGDKTKEIHVKQIPFEDGQACINDRLRVPIKPMIGCIGLAPKEGVGSTFEPAYPQGGNMDLREMAPGAILFLPVQIQGGLLSMGDLHAAMGTAEPTKVSLEAAGSATLKISVVKGMKLSYPRVRVGSSTFTFGVADTVEQAAKIALDQSFDLLTQEWGLEPFDAYAYTSACIGLRFGGPGRAIVLAEIPDQVIHQDARTGDENRGTDQ